MNVGWWGWLARQASRSPEEERKGYAGRAGVARGLPSCLGSCPPGLCKVFFSVGCSQGEIQSVDYGAAKTFSFTPP